MASIQMNMGTETEINATPNKDGLILFDTTNKKIILDNNGTREVLTKHIEANPNLNGAEQLENLKVNGEVLNFLPVDISNVEKDGEEISDILEDKYNTEGDYNTTVDKCTDLTRITPITDTAPYIYRQTPVKESFKALMKKIVGASVVWNQLVKNGNFASLGNWKGGTNTNVSVANNTLSATPKDVTVSGNRFIYNNGDFFTLYSTHKYLIKSLSTSTGSIKYQLIQNNPYSALGTVTVNCSTTKTLVYCITSPSSDTLTGRVNIVFDARDYLNVEDLQIIDLTAMFGTTIADYVYTLETSQSGSGIAWLQSYGFFTEDYYAYKQNKLESGCVSAHKTYDGETLLTNTELSPITLRGLFKLSTDKLTVDGDEYNADGSVTRKYGIVVYDGSEDESWNKSSLATEGYYIRLNSLIKELDYRNFMICDKLEVFYNQSVQVYREADNGITAYRDSNNAYPNQNWIYVKVSGISTSSELKTWLSNNPITLIYTLETPTTEQTTPFTETEIVGSTEEFIDYEVAQSNRDVAIPVGTETDYYQSYNIPPMPSTDCYLCASNQKLNWVSNS